jgi:hypothetical protein
MSRVREDIKVGAQCPGAPWGQVSALPLERTGTPDKSELKKIFHFILNKKQNRQNSWKS